MIYLLYRIPSGTSRDLSSILKGFYTSFACVASKSITSFDENLLFSRFFILFSSLLGDIFFLIFYKTPFSNFLLKILLTIGFLIASVNLF